MPAIPLYFILFIYLVFLTVFFIFAVANIYHIVTSAAFTLSSFFVTFLIFALAAFTLYSTWFLLQDVSWTVSIFDMAGGGAGTPQFLNF